MYHYVMVVILCVMRLQRSKCDAVARGLNAAGVQYFEVSHGDGLGGSSLQYGLSKVDELKLIEAAVEECTRFRSFGTY